MIEMPAPTDVANPVMLITATDRLEELQAIWLLISRFVPSENAPVAVNCWVIPAGVAGMLGSAGLMDMEVRDARVTKTVVIPEMFPEAAVMVAIPRPMPLTIPILSTVAMELLDEFQMT
jgi:hypothetical protein